MKALTAKSGMLLTLLLVIALVVFAVRSSTTQLPSEARLEIRAAKADQIQSKLNLRGMTRHLLDFYK